MNYHLKSELKALFNNFKLLGRILIISDLKSFSTAIEMKSENSMNGKHNCTARWAFKNTEFMCCWIQNRHLSC